MSKTLLTVTIFLGILALVLVSYLLVYKRDVPVPVLIENETDTSRSYASSKYGISFSYSPTYYLKEREDTSGRPQLSLVLVEDTVENRDVLEGKSDTPRDGPTAITIEVYPNLDKLAAEDWVRSDTNWTIRTTDAAPIGRGSITGITYSWSGLYEGKSVVVTEGSRAYVFSVTRLTPEDRILEDFDHVLESVELSEN